jgi:WD40 repeat protein
VKKLFAVTVWLSFVSVVCGQTLKPLARLEAPGKINFAVVCEGGGSVVGVAGEHEVSVWSLPSGKRRTISGMNGHISPSGVVCNRKALALGSSTGVVVVFDAAGAERRRIDLKGEVAALAFSADGEVLAAATTRSPVQVWDLASGKLQWTGSTDFGNTSGIRIAPGGDLIVAADVDTHVRGYDRKGKLLYKADAGLLEPFDLGLSADGKTFAVAGAEGTIALHDSATGKVLKESGNSGNPIFMLEMAPQGTKVIGFELDDFRMDPAGIAYWNTDGAELKNLAVDAKTLLGFGKGEKNLLLVRQEAPGKISVESVE